MDPMDESRGFSSPKPPICGELEGEWMGMDVENMLLPLLYDPES